MTWLVSIEWVPITRPFMHALGSSPPMGLEGAITLSLETSHFSDRLDVLACTFWAYYCQHGPSRRGFLRAEPFLHIARLAPRLTVPRRVKAKARCRAASTLAL